MLSFCKKAFEYIYKKKKDNFIKDYKYIRDKFREYLYLKRKILIIEARIDEEQINKKVYFLNDQYRHNNYFKEKLKDQNDSNTELYFNYFIHADKKRFQKYFIPKKKGSYKILLSFKNDIRDLSYMFGGCEYLKKINLNYLGKIKVTNISHFCDGCKNLSYVNISHLNTENVFDMSYMFRGCENLISLYLDSFDTRKVTNMSHMLDGCKDLFNLDISSFDMNNVTNINNIFKDCDRLLYIALNLIEIELEISDSDLNRKIYFLNNNGNHPNEELKNLNSSMVDLYIDTQKYSFRKYIEPQRTGTYNIYLIFKKPMKDCSYMFSGTKNIKKINLKFFKMQDNANFSHMFDGCESLNRLDLPKSDINVNAISYMFKGCKKMKIYPISLLKM